MIGSEIRTYQSVLKSSENTGNVFYLTKNTLILTMRHARGVIQNRRVNAEQTDFKDGDYLVYTALNRIDLYFDHKNWQIPIGHYFLAMKSQVHKAK